MCLLGIDVGTTACKVMAMSVDGQLLALEQCEYPVSRPQPEWAELDAPAVWASIQAVIRSVVARTAHDPVTALCVSSMGEAMTPVSAAREILGPSILGFDARGGEALARLQQLDAHTLYARSGNAATNLFGGPKLIWLRDHQPARFAQAYKFLNWADLVAYLLGAEPVTDYALANRSLFFDIRRAQWSPETLAYVGMPIEKLPQVAQAGTVIGQVSTAMQQALGLPSGVKIVLGTHDQCATATGAGVARAGMAVYGMGTFICITPTYAAMPPTEQMLSIRLNVEHHALPGLYVSFYYNLTGGALLKWFRDTFAAVEHAQARQSNSDIYDKLLAEMPSEPTSLMVLPHFAVTGPPAYDEKPYGMIAGVTLETTRGEFIKGLLEGVTYYFREGLDHMAAAQMAIAEFRAVGGGAKSDHWLQITTDILGKPLARPRFTEAGVLGAAILAGLGSGVYTSVGDPMQRLVKIDRIFEPHARRHARYAELFSRYHLLYPAAQALR
jgi:xylulokinase